MSENTQKLADKMAQALSAKFKKSKSTKDNKVWLYSTHSKVELDGVSQFVTKDGIRFLHEGKIYHCVIEEESSLPK